jgi:hypothetical protein
VCQGCLERRRLIATLIWRHAPLGAEFEGADAAERTPAGGLQRAADVRSRTPQPGAISVTEHLLELRSLNLTLVRRAIALARPAGHDSAIQSTSR